MPVRTVPAAGVAPLFLALALSGCAAPKRLVGTLDDGHEAVCRNLAEVVDRVDRVFGEPRAEDRERTVKGSVGARAEFRENAGPAYAVPISLRIPLPALERRANIVLRFDSVADATHGIEQAGESLDSNKTFSATLIRRRTGELETGARVELYWRDGPQTGLRPFVRWEWQPAPIRFYLEQQIYYLTDLHLGAKTSVQADYVFEDASFLRLQTSVDGNKETPSVQVEHALIYRRSLAPSGAVISLETGAAYNPFDGDPGTRARGDENDPDELYGKVRFIATVFRPWIEYEISPALHHPWHHEDNLEYSVMFTLRLVARRALPGPDAGVEAQPGPDPGVNATGGEARPCP